MASNQYILFQSIDWAEVPKVAYPGAEGVAYWQVIQFEGLRLRIVEYSAGYLADHWCQKGHVVYCLEGSFISELADQSRVELTKGMSYVVSDDLSSHRSMTSEGVKLLIIDGDFLKYKTAMDP